MDSFWGNIFGGKRTRKEVRQILRTVPLFDGLKGREIAAIERILHQRIYEPGEVIFRQGEPGVGMYIIERGDVDVVYEETNQVLAELSDGEFFGELALVDESPRIATVIAKSRSQILGFFQSDLLALIDRNPRLGIKIVMRLVSVVGERLKNSNEQLESMRRKFSSLKMAIEPETDA